MNIDLDELLRPRRQAPPRRGRGETHARAAPRDGAAMRRHVVDDDEEIRVNPVSWDGDARITKAFEDELAAHGLTIDSPRELWPEGTLRRVAERFRRGQPRLS
jgi:hypothetical protein